MTRYAFTTPDPVEVVVRNAAGEVELTCEATTNTDVVVEPRRSEDTDLAERTTVVQEGDRLRIEVPEKRWGNSPEVTVRVTVPQGSRLVARTASADVRCAGPLSALTVIAASGDVAAGIVEGDVTVQSASGDVTLGIITGDASVRTASGDVTAAKVGSLEVSTASGDVTVGSVARAMQARTASGDVRLADVAAGSVEVNTASGDIIVGVRRGTAVRLDLSSHSGDLRSELSVEETAPENGTALDLRLYSLSGDIHVRRGAAARAS